MKYLLILLPLLLVGCQVDHDISGSVDVNPPIEVIEALTPFAAVGGTLSPSIPDSTELYCTPDACITAGDARQATTVLLSSVAY